MRLLREATTRTFRKRAENSARMARREARPNLPPQIRNASTAGTANYPALRIHAVNHPGKGDDFADVLGAANPGDGALEAEAGVGDAAVAAEVEIPLERFLRQFVLVQTLQKQIVVMDTLAAADDFAVAFGGNHVEGESEVGALRIGLHVKSLDLRRVAVNQDGTVEFLRDESFFVAAEVVAEFCRVAAFV